MLNTEETVCIFNEAGIFFSVSQQQVKAQAMQEMRLELLVHLEKSTTRNNADLPSYFVDVPLKRQGPQGDFVLYETIGGERGRG